MQIGEMRRRINFCVPNVVRDDSGQQVLKAEEPWRRLIRKIPAKFGELSGGESPRGLKIEARTTAIFVIRYLRGIEATMAIELLQDVEIVEGATTDRYRLFEIVSALDLEGDKQWLTIQAAEVK